MTVHKPNKHCSNMTADRRSVFVLQCHKELGNISEATNWTELALKTPAHTDVSTVQKCVYSIEYPHTSGTGCIICSHVFYSSPRMKKRPNWRLSFVSQLTEKSELFTTEIQQKEPL